MYQWTITPPVEFGRKVKMERPHVVQMFDGCTYILRDAPSILLNIWWVSNY